MDDVDARVAPVRRLRDASSTNRSIIALSSGLAVALSWYDGVSGSPVCATGSIASIATGVGRPPLPGRDGGRHREVAAAAFVGARRIDDEERASRA